MLDLVQDFYTFYPQLIGGGDGYGKGVGQNGYKTETKYVTPRDQKSYK